MLASSLGFDKHATEMEYGMKMKDGTVQDANRNRVSSSAKYPEEKWAIRLFIAMMICLITVCIIHAVGQLVLITSICA